MQKSLIVFVALIIFVAGCTQPGAPAGATPAKTSDGGSPGQPAAAPSPAGASPPPAAPPAATRDFNTCLLDCKVVTSESLANTCKAGCYLGAATENGDIAQCEMLVTIQEGKGLYDLCVSNVATKLKDPSLCSRIKETTYHDLCLTSTAEAKGDVTVCNGITVGISQDVCISAVAAKNKNPVLCDKITESYMKEPCVENAQ